MRNPINTIILLTAGAFIICIQSQAFSQAQKVKVVNEGQKPIPVYSVSTTQPFQQEIDFDIPIGNEGNGAIFHVPAGKRLLISDFRQGS